MVKPLSRYPILLGDLKIEDAKRLHELVGECRDELFQKKWMQDLFFNRGYDMDASGMKRPESFLDVSSAVIRRNIVSASLSLLQKLMDVATSPTHIVTTNLPLIASLQDIKQARVVTPEGFPVDAVEEHQRAWMEEHSVRDLVRAYKDTLELAFGEYNLQLVLGLIHHSLRYFIPQEWKEQAELQGRIKEAFGDLYPGRANLLHLLDNAYYNAASPHFFKSATYWEKLNQAPYGKKFILSEEEATKAAWRQPA